MNNINDSKSNWNGIIQNKKNIYIKKLNKDKILNENRIFFLTEQGKFENCTCVYSHVFFNK